MNDRRNYYRILHVQPDAPLPVIRSSYRALMQKMKSHPDLGGDASDAALLNEAWSVLRDTGKRRRYDAELIARFGTLYPGRAGTAGRGGAVENGGSGQRQPPQRRHCVFCSSPLQNLEADCGCCGSPVKEPNASLGGADAQRAIQRVSVSTGGRLFTVWRYPGEPVAIDDLSPAGARLLLTHPAQTGAVAKLEGPGFKAVVRLTRCTRVRGGFAVGAEFLTVRFNEAAGTFICAVA